MEFIKRNRMGMIFIIGSIMTFIWVLFCPRFCILQGGTKRLLDTEWLSSYSRDYFMPAFHIDITYFLPGLVVIWTGVIGIMLLISDPIISDRIHLFINNRLSLTKSVSAESKPVDLEVK